MTLSTEQTASTTRQTIRPRTQFPGKYLSITSFRADGTGVATPVWFVEEDGRLYVDTDGASYKIRRIRANPRVEVAPCNATGRVKTEPVSARATVIAEMPAKPRASYEHKYRFDRVLIAPVYRLVQALRHKQTPMDQPVVLVIDPET